MTNLFSIFVANRSKIKKVNVKTGGKIEINLQEDVGQRPPSVKQNFDHSKIVAKDRTSMDQKELLALLEAVESDLYKAREENRKKETKFQNQLENYEKGNYIPC